MSVRRMIPFILVNIIVSATVVLAILFWWDKRETIPEQALSVVPTPSPRVIVQDAPVSAATRAKSSSAAEVVSRQQTYVVQAGDTLGIISQRFDVLLVDLMEVNDIENADFVSEGQTLIIPGEEEVEVISPATESPDFESVPTPIPTLTPMGEVIVEITKVMSPGNLNEESVTIINSGERQIDLSNWKLGDEQGNIYTFGTVTLFGNGVELIIHTRVGQSGLLDQFWGLNEAIWEPGEEVLLMDAEGTVRASLTVEATS